MSKYYAFVNKKNRQYDIGTNLLLSPANIYTIIGIKDYNTTYEMFIDNDQANFLNPEIIVEDDMYPITCFELIEAQRDPKFRIREQ